MAEAPIPTRLPNRRVLTEIPTPVAATAPALILAEAEPEAGPTVPEPPALPLNLADAQNGDLKPQIPSVLPILPLRNVVVFPLNFVPLSVGQPRSIRLASEVAEGDRLVGLVASKDDDLKDPGPDDVYQIGTAAFVHRMVRGSDGNIGLFVQGLQRIHIDSWEATEPYLQARVTILPDEPESTVEIEALRRSVKDLFTELVSLVPQLPDELSGAVEDIDDARALVYFVASNTRMERTEAQQLLEINSLSERLRTLIKLLTREVEVLEVGRRIQQEARGEMDKMQREYFLRQQLKAIQKELGEVTDSATDVDELEARIRNAGMPPEAEQESLRELGRLRSIPEASAEYGVIRTYLDWMVSLPWSVKSEDNLDIGHARQVLDEDHYGLEDVKARLLEFLAVQKLRLERQAEESDQSVLSYSDHRGAILALVGPPGVGKTSLGRSIARALGRQFTRMSLGGMRDEAEIRGHRRTYIGALPGRIIQGLKRSGTRNPVFILDEIDKIGASFQGDPESALLEVLDPQQNREFRDLYLDAPFDLSDVLFVCTANTLQQISGPLLDRLEIIEIAGYTDSDKVQIAKQYLVPRQLMENGLRPGELAMTEGALRRIIRDQTREAGVRDLERQVGKIVRKVAVTVAEGSATSTVIDAEDVATYLGHARFISEAAERTQVPGVATGLAYTPFGGDVLFIEASTSAGKGAYVVTGQLGDVMKESAQAALSYVRANSARLGIPSARFAEEDLHLHIPAGATPKDGPSAGVAMATALVSLLTGRPVRGDVGMTGEITLRGKVLPIGGVKEKVLAAHRAGLKTVILPRRNEPDLEEIPEEVRQSMTFVLADGIADVWDAALEPPGAATNGLGAGAPPGASNTATSEHRDVGTPSAAVDASPRRR